MFLICSLWFTCTSFAQVRQPDLNNMDLEDLTKVQVDTVSGASKFLENSTDVPASVTVVTGDEIREFGYRTLADVLQSIRGFDVVAAWFNSPWKISKCTSRSTWVLLLARNFASARACWRSPKLSEVLESRRQKAA